ncbi:hypothetical protein BWK59_05155 [Flavobacterium davisii]|uniref:Ig-like domain-containing protein n=1 Tax=Flavobacterium davisii TaxID=2906077 RepID=A0A246GJI8_9FLAO|nr:immunoglobulin domain-containing protein [Flavobacterium davisii]OWP84475.1 hypothetical protein BWK59_05155 [Flavobacterium davisii]
MKLIQNIYLYLFILLNGFGVIAQNYNDAEIGFDPVRNKQNLGKINNKTFINAQSEIDKEIDAILKEKRLVNDIIKKYGKEKKFFKRQIYTDVSTAERSALRAIFDATNGSSWNRNLKYKWDFNLPVIDSYGNSNWEGVFTANGKVIGLQFGILDSYRSLDIEGELPDVFNNLENLEFFDLSQCDKLKKDLPNSIYNLKKLRSLKIFHCDDLPFTISPNIGNLSSLEEIIIEGSNYRGAIPASINSLLKLRQIIIRSNFSGELPSFSNLSNLNTFVLSLNNKDQLYGTLEGKFGKLEKIDLIQIRGTAIIGGIPGHFFDSPTLRYLDLSHNNLNEPLPNKLFQGVSLIGIDLSNNKIIGSIPENIPLNSPLGSLRLGSNKLSGSIPKSLINCIKLTTLTFHNNDLCCEIPDVSKKNLYGLLIDNNNLRFIDLKRNFSSFQNTVGNNIYDSNRDEGFSYAPQKSTDYSEVISANIGVNITLTMCKDGRYLPNEDTFQWFKDGMPITDDSVNNRELRITNIKESDAGVYICRSKNPIITISGVDYKNLVLERNPITLTVTKCKPFGAELEITRQRECEGCSRDYDKCGKFNLNSRLNCTDGLKETYDEILKGKYLWTVKDPAGNTRYTSTDRILSYQLKTVGINTIELKFTTTTGCVYDYKGTAEVKKCPCNIPEGNIVIASERTGYKCGDRVIDNLKFEADDKGIDLSKATYQWVFKDANDQVISTVNTPNTGVTFSMPGSNSIELTVTLDGCSKVINPLKVKVVECCDFPFSGVILNFEPKINGEFFLKASFQSLWSITNKEHNPAVNSWVEYIDKYDNLKKFYTGGSENGCQYLEGKMIGRINEVEWCSIIQKGQNSTKDLELNKSKEKTQVLLKKVNTNCIGKVSHFTFSASATGIEYTWRMIDSSGLVVDTVTETKGYYQYTPTKVGSYRLNLKITTAEGCISEFFYSFEAQDCFQSCITANGNSTEVKKLVLNLLNHLREKVLNGENIPSGYICDELIDLKPYIAYPLPRIYGFSMDNKNMKFWFRPVKFIDTEPNFIATNWNTTNNQLSFSDLDLSGYTTSDYFNLDGKLILSDGSKIGKVEIRHINFCPERLLVEKCKNHVALVLDESGSLDERERAQLKRQLSAYFAQQAEINEKQGGNMYLSVIGMSNTDEGEVTVDTLPNTWRNDYIAPIKIDTNNLKSHFLPWLSNYCKKYNKKEKVTGLSEGSDFWRSGLETALFLAKESYLKLNMVVMITDGSQTTNLDKLKATMLKFNNKSLHKIQGVQDKKPHLFVIGVEKGYYVYNQETALLLSKRENPNYTLLKPETLQNENQEETNEVNENISEVNLLKEDNPVESLDLSEKELRQSIVGTTQEGALTSSLALSLKYLFDLENARTPKNSSIFPSYFKPNEKPNFQLDYCPLPDFKFLGEDINDDFLSKGIVLADLGCPYEGGKTKCNECYSFQPEPSKIIESTKILDSKNYILGAWVKEDVNIQVKEFTNAKIQVSFENTDRKKIVTYTFKPKGDIIEGWQRINEKFNVPVGSEFMIIELVNDSKGTPVFFDDIRIHPISGSMKSFVYDSENFKLMSELDENNYATFYEYDNEGGLIRIKKETLKGVKTIQETRSGNYIKVN